MKTQMKIFTVVLMTLIAMPCFAANKDVVYVGKEPACNSYWKSLNSDYCSRDKNDEDEEWQEIVSESLHSSKQYVVKDGYCLSIYGQFITHEGRDPMGDLEKEYCEKEKFPGLQPGMVAVYLHKQKKWLTGYVNYKKSEQCEFLGHDFLKDCENNCGTEYSCFATISYAENIDELNLSEQPQNNPRRETASTSSVPAQTSRTSSGRNVQKNKEYSVNSGNNANGVLNKIKSTNVAIGASISVESKFMALTDVETAVSEWEQKCDKLSTNNMKTTAETKTVGDTTKYTCVIASCSPDTEYKKSLDGKSCEKTAQQMKADKKDAKDKSAAEKQYESDIDELIEAYNTVMKKFVSECTSDGKTFTMDGCK